MTFFMGGLPVGDKTRIPWADATWNPVTGCTQIAEGCKNCYAKRQFPRVYGDRDFGDIRTHPDRLDLPYRWRRPRRIFVCSMGDLFHEHVTDAFVNSVWLRMIKNPQHTFIVLTKRPRIMEMWTEEAATFLEWDDLNLNTTEIWPEHIHVGVSISTQKDADQLVPQLLDIPAAVRIVSVEPALGPIDIRDYLSTGKISGIIYGCEKLAGARPGRHFDYDWARSMRDQCDAAGVPFFFKQAPDLGSSFAYRNGRVVEMPELDGKKWDQLPGRIE